MKVTREMLHWELQPYLYRMNAFRFMFYYKWLTKLVNKLSDRFLGGRNVDGLDCDQIYIPSSNGQYQIRTRIYRPKDSDDNLPVMIYIHGGGYITGSPEMTDLLIEKYIRTRPCVVVAPAYRTSYIKPYPAGFDDCYDTLLWVKKNNGELRADTNKIIVAGHSGGGGLTAAVTLKARDTGDVNIAFQMPIYPMIDDRQPTDPARYIEAPIWDSRTNAIGWNAYHTDLKRAGVEIPAYAAPARNTDYSNFPPTLTFVGTLDPFHVETCNYVEGLHKAGIDVAFEEFPGCFHGFESVLTKLEIAKAAEDFTYGKYAEFYDRYVG